MLFSSLQLNSCLRVCPSVEPNHIVGIQHNVKFRFPFPTRAPSLDEIQVDAVHRDDAYHVLDLFAPVDESNYAYLVLCYLKNYVL